MLSERVESDVEGACPDALGPPPASVLSISIGRELVVLVFGRER